MRERQGERKREREIVSQTLSLTVEDSESQGVCFAVKVRVTCVQTYSSRAPHLLLYEHWVKLAPVERDPVTGMTLSTRCQEYPYLCDNQKCLYMLLNVPWKPQTTQLKATSSPSLDIPVVFLRSHLRERNQHRSWIT